MHTVFTTPHLVDVNRERFHHLTAIAARWHRTVLREVAFELTFEGEVLGAHEGRWLARFAAAITGKLAPKGIDARALAADFGLTLEGKGYAARARLARELVAIAGIDVADPEAFAAEFVRALERPIAREECDALIESAMILSASVEDALGARPRPCRLAKAVA